MKDRILWLIFALISFVLLIPITNSFYKEWKVYANGKIVEVTIISLPNEHSLTNFMKFNMDGHIYDKRLNKGDCAIYNVGEKIQLRYLKGYEDFFLFPNEDPFLWGIGGIILFLFLGGCCLYYGLRKNYIRFRLPLTKK